jgi:UTP--glucose-1-phosphate uridylyltransferase
MSKRVRKAVFPIAGLGTRLLPATKSIPKELIPIVDRPLIQYALDEAREAGIEQMIFVTGRGKSALDDYFDMGFELETTMRERGKSLAALEPTRTGFGEIVSVRQQQPLGLGHAVWCARDIVGDEPFAVILPDDLMVGTPGALKQMVDAWENIGGNLVATEEVPADKTGAYGIIAPGATNGSLTEVLGLVEKPDPADAPSRLGVIGRYILQADVLRVLDAGETGAGGEIQLTDALAKRIGKQPFNALKVAATRYDCGDRAGFVIANLALALAREDVGPKVREFIATL